MTAIRLLLAEVEGTLLTSSGALTPATRNAVDSLRNARVELAITSASPPRAMRPLIETLGITTPVCGLDGGMLVANPVPAEAEIPAAEIAGHIDAALREAAAKGITGKAVTPFLLDAIVRSTGGRSLATNIALVKNNARLAADIAVALAKT